MKNDALTTLSNITRVSGVVRLLGGRGGGVVLVYTHIYTQIHRDTHKRGSGKGQGGVCSKKVENHLCIRSIELELDFAFCAWSRFFRGL